MSLKKTLNEKIDQYILENPKQPNEIGYYNKIASIFNVHPEKVRKRWRQLQAKENLKSVNYYHVLPENPSTIDTYDASLWTVSTASGDAQCELITEEEIKNEKDLVRIAKIDTDIFTVTHFQVKTSQVRADGKFKRIYTVKISLKAKKIDTNIEEQKQLVLDSFKKDAAEYIKRIKSTDVRIAPFVKIDVAQRAERVHALEISIPDLHIGKLAWGKESGKDYDIKIATARYKDAVKDLIGRVNPLTLEKIILPIGNDMINIDNKANTTTGGTPQSSDSRFGKMFQTAKELLIDTIKDLSVIAPVEVIVVPGNHDSVAMFTLGEVLSAWFHNDGRVSVINTPAPRKYLQYGKNGLMYVHGDKEKHAELGIIFATEQPKLWADTEFRICKVGHLHKSKKMQFISVDEFHGFRVQIIPSLSENDAWHSEQGYNSKRAAKAFLYHRDNGEVAEFTYYV